MAYSSREELLALPGQISLLSVFADKLLGFFFLSSSLLLKLQPFKKSMLHRMVLILKSPLVQAQGPVSSSDAAVKTQTSWLLRLTNAPKQLWYQYQFTALVFSFLFIFIPRRPLTNKVSNTFKRKFITLHPAFLTALYW